MSLPPVERVVVAVADEGTDTGPVELCQAIDEAQLGPQTTVCPVIYVGGHQQGIRPLPEAEIDDVLLGVEGGVTKFLGYVQGDTKDVKQIERYFWTKAAA